MKKFVGLLLSFVMLVGLCACGNNSSDVSSTISNDTEIITLPVETPEISEPIETSEKQSENTVELTESSESIETTEMVLPKPAVKIDNNLTFDLSWESVLLDGSEYDLDIVAFMLDSDNVCYDSNGFIFYNNNISPDNAIKLSADIKESDTNLSETMTIDLSLVSEDTTKIAIWVCRFYEDDYDISELSAANLIIKGSNSDILTYSISEGVSYEVCELVKESDGWYLNDISVVSELNLADICRSYGLSVD